jgi:hypothetical protein
MQVQIVTALKRPTFALSASAITILLALIFLYFDEFYFVAPYLSGYIPLERLPILILDVIISIMSGIVVTLSVYEIRAFPDLRRAPRRTGLLGIVAALVAGACPCYYLVPLLAVAGGVGGILGTIGILFFNYQIPIKLASLALLSFSIFTVERSLSAVCEIVPARSESE